MGMFAMRSLVASIIAISMWMSGKRSWRRWKKTPSSDLGMLPEKEFSPEDIRGKFIEGTTHLKRRKESGRKPMHLGIILVVIAVLIYLWYAISNGII